MCVLTVTAASASAIEIFSSGFFAVISIYSIYKTGKKK
jgi:hypothetical protein